MVKKELSPDPQDIKDLRKRHGITQKQLCNSLYGVKQDRIGEWERGWRSCPPIVWWAMLLTWDRRDLWVELHLKEKA